MAESGREKDPDGNPGPSTKRRFATDDQGELTGGGIPMSGRSQGPDPERFGAHGHRGRIPSEDTWSRLNELVAFAHLDDGSLPDGVEWSKIDRALVQLAKTMIPNRPR